MDAITGLTAADETTAALAKLMDEVPKDPVRLS
jgi:hypothetical protein